MMKNQELKEHYQLFPMKNTKNAPDKENYKVLCIEIKTLKFSKSTRQLLVISDLTEVLKYESKKIRK